jgi:dTDP-4-amino-4,6-dideoxygalactose transaminase
MILKLRERGIESQAYFPAIHKQPYIADTAVAPLGSLKWTEDASERCLALPFFPSMKSEEVTYVSETLGELLDAELRPQTAGMGAFATAPEVPA